MRVCHAGAMSDEHTAPGDDFEDVMAGEGDPAVDEYELSTRPLDGSDPS